MTAVEVLLLQLDPGLEPPSYAHAGDAGADLRSREDFELEPGERRLVGTGVAICLPTGYAAFVHPRSGLAAQHGISIVNAPGTVDAGYRGEIKVCLINTDRSRSVSIARGDRIAQLVIQPVSLADVRASRRAAELGTGSWRVRIDWRNTGPCYWVRGHRAGNHLARGREHNCAKGTHVIFKRGRKRGSESAVEESTEDAGVDELDESTEADQESVAEDVADEDFTALDELDWRSSGPYDISEVESIESTEESPKIDLGSLILTAVPNAELRLQVAEETGEIVSAMLVLETIVEPPASANQKPQTYSSALELGAYAAPRSGGLWAELREEISRSATEAGGTASLGEGPFGVELRRLIPVTTPDGEEGYQPSRMWVAEGPRWLLRGIVYGQAAIEDDADSPVVADVLVRIPTGDRAARRRGNGTGRSAAADHADQCRR